MARRANGEGSIIKLAKDRWRVVISVRQDGVLKRISRVCRTRADALAKRDELLAKHRSDAAKPAVTGTVGEFLGKWLRSYVQANLSHNTFISYSNAINKHIIPRMGSADLRTVTPMMVEELFAAMQSDGYGARVRQITHMVLKTAMKHAVEKYRVLTVNPVASIGRPKYRRGLPRPFEADEVRLILDDLRGDHWYAFFVVAFSTGMRCGELWGLRWSDVDMKAKTVFVQQQMVEVYNKAIPSPLKTESSRRQIELPQVAVDALREHKALLLKSGLVGCELCFPNRSGSPQNRANFHAGTWRPLLKRLGLTARGLHQTRHTFATLALSSGVPLSAVAKSLGHSSELITLKSYSHLLPSVKSMASDAIQRLIG